MWRWRSDSWGFYPATLTPTVEGCSWGVNSPVLLTCPVWRPRKPLWPQEDKVLTKRTEMLKKGHHRQIRSPVSRGPPEQIRNMDRQHSFQIFYVYYFCCWENTLKNWIVRSCLLAPVTRIAELTMTLPNNDNSLSVQRWTWASTIERMKFVSSNMLEATQNIGSLVAHLVKETACQCRRRGFNPWIGKFPWRRKWQPTPVFLPKKFHGQRSLAGYSPWGRKESDTTEYTHTHTHTRTQANEKSKSQTFTHGILATWMLA